MNKIRVQGDGTPTGTKVTVLNADGTETDISDQVKSVTLIHEAARVPQVVVTLILAEFDLTGEHKPRLDGKDDDHQEPPSDPRTGMVRWV